MPLYSAGHTKHEWTSWAAMEMIFADMDQAMDDGASNSIEAAPKSPQKNLNSLERQNQRTEAPEAPEARGHKRQGTVMSASISSHQSLSDNAETVHLAKVDASHEVRGHMYSSRGQNLCARKIGETRDFAVEDDNQLMSKAQNPNRESRCPSEGVFSDRDKGAAEGSGNQVDITMTSAASEVSTSGTRGQPDMGGSVYRTRAQPDSVYMTRGLEQTYTTRGPDGRDGRFRSVSTVSNSDNLYSSRPQMAAPVQAPQHQQQAIQDSDDDLGDFGDDFNKGDKSSQLLDPDTSQGPPEVQVEKEQTDGISSNIIWCASLVLMMTMIRQGMTSNCHYRSSFVPMLHVHQFVMLMVIVKVSLVRLRLWIWPWPPRGMTEWPPDSQVYTEYETQKRSRGRPRRPRLSCESCGKQFLSKTKFERHQEGHRKEEKADFWYVCPHKDCSFTRKKKVNIAPLSITSPYRAWLRLNAP